MTSSHGLPATSVVSSNTQILSLFVNHPSWLRTSFIVVVSACRYDMNTRIGLLFAISSFLSTTEGCSAHCPLISTLSSPTFASRYRRFCGQHRAFHRL